MVAKKQFKLGDAISKLTKIFRIPHCQKCEKRRLILNEIQKLGVKETAKMLKNSEKENWSLEDIINKMKDCCNKQ